mmetsp:Transcript_15642/g.28017  ORF Transcript_15642/g.28017 Transcript_15642/m.28017 type:complete len:318 (-) Transcript_15642:78-1031(-)
MPMPGPAAPPVGAAPAGWAGVSVMGSFSIARNSCWFALICCSRPGLWAPICCSTGSSAAGLVCTSCLSALSCGWFLSSARAPPPAGAGDAPPAGAGAAPPAGAGVGVGAAAGGGPVMLAICGGMPPMRNSTARSAPPPTRMAASSAALASDSGKPMPVRGASCSAVIAGAVGAGAAAGVGAGAAAGVGEGAAAGVVVAVAAGAGVGVGVGSAAAFGAGAGVGAAAGAAAAADFLGLETITTRKSSSLMPLSPRTESSFSTLPAWISFCCAAGNAELVVSIWALTCAIVRLVSTSIGKFLPVRVFTVSFMLPLSRRTS